MEAVAGVNRFPSGATRRQASNAGDVTIKSDAWAEAEVRAIAEVCKSVREAVA